MEKIYKIIKTIIFITFGILILIFNNQFMEENPEALKYVVGGIMLFYGLEEAIFILVEHKLKEELVSFNTSLITILFGLITIFALNDLNTSFIILCVLWSSWSIMRESQEIVDKVILKFKNKFIASINLVESIVVIVLSIMLLINPGHHHAHVHLILLAIELFLEVAWPHLDIIESKARNKK